MQWILAIFYMDGDFIQTSVGAEDKILSIINYKVVSGTDFESLEELSDYLDSHFEEAANYLDPDIRFTVATMDGKQYIVW